MSLQEGGWQKDTDHRAEKTESSARKGQAGRW